MTIASYFTHHLITDIFKLACGSHFNAQQEVKSQESSKRDTLGPCQVDNHARYGKDIVAEGPTMSAVASSALVCSREHRAGLGVMLSGASERTASF